MNWIDHVRLVITVGLLLMGGWLVMEVRKTNRLSAAATSGESPLRGAFRRLIWSRAAQVGGITTYGILLAVFAGPWLIKATTGLDYDTSDLSLSKLPPAWWSWFGYKSAVFAPKVHLWGTDKLGRDLFVRCMVGGEISIGIGVVTASIVLLVGVFYGAYAAQKGGHVDTFMMRVVDVFYTLPFVTFVIVVMSLFDRNIVILFVAIGFTSWLTLARIERGQVLSLMKEAFVEAAVACGSRDRKILFLHLIKNTVGVVAIYITVITPAIMLAEAFLSFLSYGIRPPLASWGVLVSEGNAALRYQPWMAIFPISCLGLTLFSLSNLGDGIRDAFDPKVRGFRGRLQDQVMIRAGKTPNDSKNVLEVGNLSVEFDVVRGQPVRAVTEVSFVLPKGGIMGLVGESGCGKTTLGFALMGLNPSPPSIVTGGTIRFGGKDLLRLPENLLRGLRGDSIAMIFQDAQAALNPFHTVGRQLLEVFTLHRTEVSRREARQRCIEMLREVGMPDPAVQMKKYPHQLSGGMQQRVMIAMALLLEPEVLIADEPTTALDVTVQLQITKLLKDLRDRRGTAIILITHDLGVVAQMADSVAVMYAGRIVEYGTARAVFKNPRHPYTRGLLASIPSLEGDRKRLVSIPGQPPRLDELLPGCPFYKRCSDPGKHDGCQDKRQVFVPGRNVQCARKEVA